MVLGERVGEAKATGVLGCEDVMCCGTGGKGADGTDGSDELGSVGFKALCGRVRGP